jgi:hypothetical protein
MNELSARQRALLGFLAAYYGEGFTPDVRSTLPEAVLPDLDALIECGLVEVRFIPRPPSITALEPPPKPPPAPVAPRGRKTPLPRAGKSSDSEGASSRACASVRRPSPARRNLGGGWTEERKAAFIAALRPGEGIGAANVAVGLKVDSTAPYSVKRADPAFAARWDEARRRPTAPASQATAEAQPAAKTPPRDVPAPAPPSRAAAAVAPPRLSDAAIASAALANQEEKERIAAMRPPLTAAMAQTELQRRGRTVYRASVTGGPKGCWVVSGLGKEVTEAQLIAEAQRVLGHVKA